jgi:hypothetical protein
MTDVTIRLRLDGASATVQDITRVENALDEINNTSQNVTSSATTMGGALKGAFAAVAGSVVVGQLISVLNETEKLRGSLETVTGSASKAATAFDALTDFATKTPFELEQSVSAFIKLKSLGLQPTEAALTSFGNTSAAMGKDLNQMIEAVADAATGEFERLKEFGIRAKQQGDSVSLTFQGVTTTIGNNSEEIQKYLVDIGNVNFAGAMEAQMERLPGKFSNLGDAISGLGRAFGDAGATEAIGMIVSGLTDLTVWVTEKIPIGLAYLRAAFVEEFGKIDYKITLIGGAFEILTTSMQVLWDNALSSIRTKLAEWADSAAGLLGKVPLDIAQDAAAGLQSYAAQTAATVKPQQDLGATVDAVKAKLKAKLTAIEENTRALMDETVNAAYAREQNKTLASALDGLAGSGGRAAAGIDKASEAAAKNRRAVSDLIDEYAQRDAMVRMSERDQARYTAQLKLSELAASKGVVVTDQQRQAIDNLVTSTYDYEQAQEAAAEADKKAVEARQKAIEEAQKKMEAEAQLWQKVVEGAVERVNGAFVEMWKNVGSGFDSFSESLKDAFKQLLAELAHMALTRPIVMKLGAALGMTGGSGFAAAGESAAGGAASMFSGLSSIGSLLGGIKSTFGGISKFFSGMKGGGGLSGGFNALYATRANPLGYGSGLSEGLSEFRFALGDISRSLGMEGLAGKFDAQGLKLDTFGQSLVDFGANLGAGMAGSWAGNKVGSALFGERKTTGVGSTLGGVVGSAWGPIGTAIGSFIGSIAENAIGKIFGTGDLVKWGKLGISTGKDIPTDGSALKTVTAASGLTLSAVAKRTDKDAALQLLDAFTTLDATLTEIAKAAGVTVDFANRVLGTTSLNVDNEGPKNSFGVGARLDEFSADAIENSADEFARQWIAEIADQLPQRVKSLLGDTAKQTAAQLVDLFNVGTVLDRLLSIKVVDEVEKAAQTSATTLLDLYDTSTEAVVNFAQEMTGSIEQLGLLNEKLAEQKQVAAQLAVAYAEAASVVQQTFGQAIETIQNELLSADELYEKRRDQIADLTAQLGQTVDPQKIAELTSRIDSLASAAWQQLDETQKKSMGEEFITFLRNAQALAEQQIAAGQTALIGRETALASGIDLEVMRSAAEIQSAAAQQFADAAQIFAGAVAGWNGGSFNWERFLSVSSEVNN